MGPAEVQLTSYHETDMSLWSKGQISGVRHFPAAKFAVPSLWSKG
jgi:hypothetical protein